MKVITVMVVKPLFTSFIAQKQQYYFSYFRLSGGVIKICTSIVHEPTARPTDLSPAVGSKLKSIVRSVKCVLTLYFATAKNFLKIRWVFIQTYGHSSE